MDCFFRSAVCGVLGVLFLWSSPPLASAQPRSFAAIGSIELDPPLPGTEKVHRELAQFLKPWKSFTERHVSCTLRADLPKPRVLGLVCRDRVGRYIGTLRAKGSKELRDRLYEYFCSPEPANPDALPLHEYRYILVRPGKDEWDLLWANYLAQLLRADGAWQVVTSPDMVPMVPTGEADRLLVAQIGVGGVGEWFAADSAVVLVDRVGKRVRRITGGSEWTGGRGAVRAVFHKLMDARRLDEETHQPLPAGPREPK